MLEQNFFRRQKSFFIILLLFLAATCAPVLPAFEPTISRQTRTNFSEAVGKSLATAAEALDKTFIKLVKALDATDNIAITTNSHFYDSNIRRYFISISGNVLFGGRTPITLKKSSYVLSGNSEISFDVTITDIKNIADGITFSFNGAIVVSMDRLAYQMMQTIPHLAASGAMAPAFELLGDFLNKLNIGILSEAISETFRRFSTVAITKTTTELLSAAGKNRHLGKLIRESCKNGTILDFLTLSIIKSASISLVSVGGATMGSTIGSLVAPGPGSVVGAYIGSQVATLIAKTAVYRLTEEIPMKMHIKRMINSYHILQDNKADASARATFNRSMSKITKKINHELDSEKFKLFESFLKEVDELAPEERVAMVPLLKSLQYILNFKVTNDGDWYYARQYFQLKMRVEKWGMQAQIPFSTDPKILQNYK